MKSQFGFLQHPKPRETRRGAFAVRHTSSQFQSFRPVLPLPLLPQELARYDQPSTKLQPLVLENMEDRRSSRLPDNPLFLVRSTEYLPRCHRKRCAPNRAQWLIQSGNTQDCDAWRVQLNPTQSGPLQQDYAQSKRDSLPNLAQGLMRSYHS